jgi:hypothetical protein
MSLTVGALDDLRRLFRISTFGPFLMRFALFGPGSHVNRVSRALQLLRAKVLYSLRDYTASDYLSIT